MEYLGSKSSDRDAAASFEPRSSQLCLVGTGEVMSAEHSELTPPGGRQQRRFRFSPRVKVHGPLGAGATFFDFFVAKGRKRV
jgi:hypothetical protein